MYFVTGSQVIDRGRIPIIKAQASEGGAAHTASTVVPIITDGVGLTVEIDITMHSQSHTGITSTAFVCELVEFFPPIRPLTLVLKVHSITHMCRDCARRSCGQKD